MSIREGSLAIGRAWFDILGEKPIAEEIITDGAGSVIQISGNFLKCLAVVVGEDCSAGAVLVEHCPGLGHRSPKSDCTQVIGIGDDYIRSNPIQAALQYLDAGGVYRRWDEGEYRQDVWNSLWISG